MRYKSLLSGAISLLPGGNAWLFDRYKDRRPDAGTSTARYCYAVWLRHLVLANRLGSLEGVPHTIAELGPGNSLGTGLAALISGVAKYYAFDVVTYLPNEANIVIFDELVDLYRERADIPRRDEFPAIKTELDDYGFPTDILSNESLNRALDPGRIALLREALVSCGRGFTEASPIAYVVPWNDPSIVSSGTVDMVLSMSVLEHIDDLPAAYAACSLWLKPGGIMSHEIDFRCHGLTDDWNGHWGHSKWIWKIIRGRRAFLINRQPHSVHVENLESHGFHILANRPQFFDHGLGRRALAAEFSHLTDLDITTHNAYILARRR